MCLGQAQPHSAQAGVAAALEERAKEPLGRSQIKALLQSGTRSTKNTTFRTCFPGLPAECKWEVVGGGLIWLSATLSVFLDLTERPQKAELYDRP